MLMGHPFLLGEQPRFVDFDLYGMLGNFLYSGHYRLPAAHAPAEAMAPAHGKTQIRKNSHVKNYVLDTNVLLHDPNSLLSFQNNNVLIPIEVIEEIDRFKRESTELGQNARTVSRTLDGLRGQGSLSEGVKLENGGRLRIIFQKHDPNQKNGHVIFGDNTVDSRIVALALAVQKAQPKRPTILVSKDINLRIKADALGLQAEDYETDRVLIKDLYTGMIELTVSAEKMAAFRANGELELNGGGAVFSERILHADGGDQSQAHGADQGGSPPAKSSCRSLTAARASGASNRATASSISPSTRCWMTASSWSR